MEKAKTNLPYFFLQRSENEAIEMMIKEFMFQNCVDGYDNDPLGNAKSCFFFKKFLRERGFVPGDLLTVINIKNMKKLNVDIGFARGDKLLSDLSTIIKNATTGNLFRLISGDKYLAFSEQIDTSKIKLPVPFEIIKMETLKSTEEKDWMFINPETNHDFILNAIVTGENEYFKLLSKELIAS